MITWIGEYKVDITVAFHRSLYYHNGVSNFYAPIQMNYTSVFQFTFKVYLTISTGFN